MVVMKRHHSSKPFDLKNQSVEFFVVNIGTVDSCFILLSSYTNAQHLTTILVLYNHHQKSDNKYGEEYHIALP